MHNKEQGQNQQQNIDIGFEKHGVVTEIHCPYYTDERAEYLKVQRDRGEEREQIKNKDLYFKSQLVKAVIYEGNVKKVFCIHFDNSAKQCNSPLSKPDETKNCYIIG